MTASRLVLPLLTLVSLLPISTTLAQDEVAPKQVRVLGQLNDWCTALAISPDDTLVAAGTYEEVRIWEMKTGKLQHTIKKLPGYVKSLAFTSENKSLIIGAYQTVLIADVAEGKIIREIEKHFGDVTDVELSPDGQTIASCSDDESIRFTNLDSGEEQLVITETKYPVYGIAFSPDGKQLASASGDETRITQPGLVRLWNVEDGQLINEFEPHKKQATCVRFSPQGNLLLSGGIDEKANLYDVETGKPKGFYGGHSRPINQLIITPDGRTVISASGGRFKGMNEVRIWNLITGDEHAAFEPHQARVTDIAITSDTQYLVTGSYDKAVIVWDLTEVLKAIKAFHKTP